MRRLLATLLTLATLALPRPAFAHGHLKSSQPAAGAHLSAGPRELRFTFTEVPELAFTTVRLVGPTGLEIALDSLRAVPNARATLLAAVRGTLGTGRYTVRWRMAGADGHPTVGTFSFTIDSTATGLASAATDSRAARAPSPPMHHDTTTFPARNGFDAESPAYAAIRWLQFVALLAVIGAVAFQFVVLRIMRARGGAPQLETTASRRTAGIATWACVGLVAIAVVRLYAQSLAMHGASGALVVDRMLRMVGETTWGRGWALQVIAAFVAFVGFSVARQTRFGWSIATAGVLALAFTPGLSGHAASAPQLTALAVVSDATHVIGAGGWLGGLSFVVIVGVPAALTLAEPARGAAVADLVNAFSPTALVFAALTLATGLFATWMHLGGLSALWHMRYGQLLLWKLGALGALTATGAYNWLRVRPSLGLVDAAARVRRSSTIELLIGVLVLAITAVLVATPTAMDAAAMQVTP